MSKEETKRNIDKKTFRIMFLRSFLLQGTWNYINGQGAGVCYTMIPFLKKLYPNKEDRDKRVEALKRSISYINITPAFSTYLFGILAKMEEKNSKDPTFDSNSINALKTSLMGSISAIGDSFTWGTVRVISVAIGIGLASQGSLLGPVLFLILYNIPMIFTRYYGLKLGYSVGAKFLEKANDSGLISVVTRAAVILAMIMIGALIYNSVTISLNGILFSLQGILDQVLVGILPLSATIICFILLKKKVNSDRIMVALIIISFALSYFKLA